MSKRGNYVPGASAMLREWYGHAAAKQISYDFGVAMRTAKLWLGGCFPESRIEQLVTNGRRILDERARKDEEYRRKLESLGGTVRGFYEGNANSGLGAWDSARGAARQQPARAGAPSLRLGAAAAAAK